jgi:2-polyprenyl-3-methyl-5-hydroxy-6-metoxy-1,4-benzoquinol methylase
MSPDNKTIAVYDDQAAEYADFMLKEGEDPALIAFIAALPKGAHVLDLGCGPGWASAEIAKAGHKVTATDASREMIAMASKFPGVTAINATFDDITGTALYDGIWANFSLLHAPRSAMPRHLAALATALKPGGQLHIAVKTGQGETRDKIGRLYTYYGIDELIGLLADVGLTVSETRTGEGPGLSGETASWVALTAHAPLKAVTTDA